MKQEKNAMQEELNEEKGTAIPDELLEGINGGVRTRRRPKKPIKNKPNTNTDDGSGGATTSW